MWAQGTAPLVPLAASFPDGQFPATCGLISSELSAQAEPLHSSGDHSVFAALSSLCSAPRTPASLVFPGSALFPHLKDSTRLRLDLFFLQHGQETLKAKAGATAGSPRVISFLRDRCLLSHLLKTNVSCVLSCLSVVSDGKVNLVPDSLSWLEAHQLHFKL